jgi:hypothetical protein
VAFTYPKVVALQPIMRGNGTTPAAGQLAASGNGLFYGDLLLAPAGQVGYAFLVAPCTGVKMLTASMRGLSTRAARRGAQSSRRGPAGRAPSQATGNP